MQSLILVYAACLLLLVRVSTQHKEDVFPVEIVYEPLDQNLVRLSFRSEGRSIPHRTLTLTSNRVLSSGESCDFYSNIRGESFAAFSRCTTSQGIVEIEGAFAHKGSVYSMAFDPVKKQDVGRVSQFDGRRALTDHTTHGIEWEDEVTAPHGGFAWKQHTSLPLFPNPVIEVLILMDQTFIYSYQKQGKDGEKVVLQSAHMANAIFQPLNVSLEVTAVHVIDERDTSRYLRPAKDWGHLLDKSVEYFKRKFLTKERFTGHPDAVITFTDMAVQDRIPGIAFTDSICGPNAAVILGPDVKEKDHLIFSTLEMGLTVAHELGHVLGFEHQEEEECDCTSDDGYCVMFPSNEISNFLWTECERSQLRERLQRTSFDRHMDCLFTRDVYANEKTRPESPAEFAVHLKPKCEDKACNNLILSLSSAFEADAGTLKLRKSMQIFSNGTDKRRKMCDFFIQRPGQPMGSIWWCRSLENSKDRRYEGRFHWKGSRRDLKYYNGLNYGLKIESYILANRSVLPDARVLHQDTDKVHEIEVFVALDVSFLEMNVPENHMFQLTLVIMNFADAIFRQVGVAIRIAFIDVLPKNMSIESMEEENYLSSTTRYLISRSNQLNISSDVFLVLTLREPDSDVHDFRSHNTTACNNNSKTLVVNHEEGEDFKTGVNVAHQLTHLLGLRHESGCGCRTSVGDCVTSSHETRGGVWSECEYRVLKSGTDSSHCLLNRRPAHSRLVINIMRGLLLFSVILFIILVILVMCS